MTHINPIAGVQSQSQTNASAMELLKLLREARATPKVDTVEDNAPKQTDEAHISARSQRHAAPAAEAGKPSVNEMERLRSMLLGTSTSEPVADPDRMRVLELLGGD
ncbi:MAG: hypothetical protein H6815_13420 [Phycisphaeraceae bacterium]|nr:hypothetical protein [Phycisphaerales bacterium]MCB9861438.1 hypothetical protein [Phycisphaeraceae bacterium]